MHRILIITLGLLALLVTPAAAIAEIYRVIDADGNISFTDKPPADSAKSKAEPVNVDASTQNTSRSPEAIQQDQPEWLREAQEKRRERAEAERAKQPSKDQVKAWKKSLRDAESELREAKKALKQGVVASEGDFIGKAGGGVRPSEQYFEKLKALEQNVVNAQGRVDALKRNGPSARRR